MDRALLVMIAIALILGMVVSYSTLYFYPYQEQPLREAAGATQALNISREITIPLSVQHETSRASQQIEGAAPITTTPPLTIYRGHAVIVGAELLGILENDGKIYLTIRLNIGGNLSEARDLSLVRVTLTPLAFPYAWNGSSWVYGADEERCLARIPLPVEIVSHSYNISSVEGQSIVMSLRLDLDRPSVYGRYSLSILVKLGNNYYNIEREVGLGGYVNPPHPSPVRSPACS
ncbi:MAG TPA: hypothetical protein VNL13_01885 [Sulfolobales archaeon]|nr:hypothetical protein [Sulfolobales archaeon]